MKSLLYVSSVILMIFTWPAQTESAPLLPMNVHFIDVGQGDSILIQTPGNKTILVDGGPQEAGKKVTSYLQDLEIDTIDLVIATHPDFDHIGGLIPIMKNFKVKQIIDNGKFHLTKTYAQYMNEIRKQDIPKKVAKEGQKIKLDSKLKIEVLNAYESQKNNNQSAIVLKISYKDIDFLLMSDVEMEQEKKLIKKSNIQSEIIKVAHHGSDTSTSLPFLKHVSPKVAILTYSPDNDYGHPVERVIENLDRMDVNIYSTAIFGDVIITTNGKNYFVMTEKDPFDNLDGAA